MGNNKIEKEEYVKHGWSLREDVEGTKIKWKSELLQAIWKSSFYLKILFN